MMEKKVIDFAHSESDSSSESESPRAARGSGDAVDGYESDEYGAFKDHLRSGVDFQPIPPLRSSRSLAPSFSLKSSSGVTERRGDAGGKEDRAPYAAVIVSMIDGKMKGHVGRVLRAAHVISAQITRLENSSNQFEGLIDNLKDSTEFYHKKTERRLRELEDMMTEVQSGIQDLRDKQKIAEVQLQLAMVQQIRVDLQPKQRNRNTQNKVVQQQVSSAHSQDHQPHPSPAACQQNPSNLPSYAPPYSPQPQSSSQIPANTATTFPQQLGQNQSNFIQQYRTCTRPPLPTPDSANQQHHMFLTQSSVTQHRPYMHPSFPESSQLPHPQIPYSTLHTSVDQVHQQPPQRPYMPSESSATAMTPLHHRPGHGNVSDYGARPPPHCWSSTMKTSQPPPPSFSPTPKALPHALPMAMDVTEASSSGGTESKASIEDIVENAVAMGFRRNAVKATVKKLTENGQQVDLNLVLDKLINSGEPQ
ncbi:hypothetical protein QN277_025563 [Acacia crassicarpa]|uniref:DUF1421 domain-containing protein n=1 Tax=Acacia crassicarpa TaxID=499986 RepID=A0AAE1J639_9FABA|nr:hypothetical protein QN277_025563 [Acacia crassicarpa]